MPRDRPWTARTVTPTLGLALFVGASLSALPAEDHHPRAPNPALGALDVSDGPRAQVVEEISWNQSRVERVKGGRLEPRQDGQAFDALRVSHRAPGMITISLLRIPSPKLRHRRYALMGRIRTLDVKGEGFLEMWSQFPEKGRYFSRTLAPDGPLQSLTGTQPWRRFALPFDAQNAPGPPKLLELNLVLPGPGTVWLGPLRLVELPPQPPQGQRAPPRQGSDGPPPAVPPWQRDALWWSPEVGWWLGLVGAGVLGALAMVLFVVAPRPSGPLLVRPLVTTLGVLGAGALTLGVVAAWLKQPPLIHLPLFALGSLSWLVSLVAAWLVRRRGPRPRRR